MTAASEAAGTDKAAATRARILDSALDLFRERGYEQATMRAIARRAGVALGNAYYYFRSKEEMVLAFYARTHVEHLTACAPVLERERELRRRLLGVMRAKIATLDPYHRVAGVLFRTAADPASPLNPFGSGSSRVREESRRLFARVVEGSRDRIPPDLRAELPGLLWLYQMGIVLVWIHDRTRGRARTHRLTGRSVELVAKLVALASLGVLRPLRRALLRVLAELREDGS